MKLTKTTQVEVPIGMFLVRFDPIWGQHCNEGKHDDCFEHGCMDNEPSYIADIEGSVTEITLENWQNLSVEGYTLKTNTNDQYGDTHDIRDRVFTTLKDAEDHKNYTEDRFKNPQPWECFVRQA